MGKRVDITDKLSFEGNPILILKGRELEVNADAPTMLKVMALMDAEDPGSQEIVDAYDMIFPQASKDMIKDLKLNFKDLVVVVQEAIKLISGTEDNADQGE